jgi:hypothetical protein
VSDWNRASDPSEYAANAQQPASESGLTETDDELMVRGVELRKQGRDAEALVTFERAYALRPTPRAVAQIALAQQALARWRDAERGLLDVLGNADDAWVARQRIHLEESLAAVRARLAWLEVEGDIAGAEVWVSGELCGWLPLDRPVRVVAGDLSVEVRAHGHAPIQRTVHVDPTSQVHQVFTFMEHQTVGLHASADSVLPVAVRGTSAPKTAGWVTLGSAGGLLLVGVAGLVTREWEARIYDDDSTCGPSSGMSRSMRCGTNRNIGMAAQTIAIVAFVGAGVAASAAGVVLLGNRPQAPKTGFIGCGLAGIGMACNAAF